MKHVLLSLRTIFRFKTYTGINVVGLALSLACVFILVRYIHPSGNDGKPLCSGIGSDVSDDSRV